MQSGIERWCSGTLIILINNGIRYLGNRISSLLHEGNFAKFCEYYQMEILMEIKMQESFS